MKRQLLSAAICAAITAYSPLSFAQSDDSGGGGKKETAIHAPTLPATA